MKPPKDKPGVTVTQLQDQIAALEGFRVSFERYGAADVPIVAYPFGVMAPSKWRISDWKTPGASWLRVRRDAAGVVGMGKSLSNHLKWRSAVTNEAANRVVRGVESGFYA